MNSKQWLHVIAFILVIVGGLNWGLVGLLNFNLVDALFGMVPLLGSLIYILVGLSAVYLIVVHKTECKTCMMMQPAPKGKAKKK